MHYSSFCSHYFQINRTVCVCGNKGAEQTNDEYVETLRDISGV